MPAYLLKPVVCTCECKMLTQGQLNKLLRGIKSKKFGTSLVAVDVEEIVTKKVTEVNHRYEPNVRLQPGSYFNVHVEYVV